MLSKGHCAPGYYAALALKGFFPMEELQSLRHIGAMLQGHPDMKGTPGVDMSTGSLGQGISAAAGMALAGKLDGHLMDIDRRATEMVEQLTRELAQQNRVDEEMKATNQMAWVQAMNNFKASAEEVVLRQLIYS